MKSLAVILLIYDWFTCTVCDIVINVAPISKKMSMNKNARAPGFSTARWWNHNMENGGPNPTRSPAIAFIAYNSIQL